jgi:hypothetical protein
MLLGVTYYFMVGNICIWIFDKLGKPLRKLIRLSLTFQLFSSAANFKSYSLV